MAKAMPPKPAYDTLIIAGGQGTRAAMLDPTVQAFVKTAMKTARRVCSVCSGAYILAQAGVLERASAPPRIGAAPPISRSAIRT